MAKNQREGAARETRSRERALLAALFVLGFCVRSLFADGDFFGDESWYFYLSQGFGREAAVQFEQPWFHIANRPLFYAFYHLSTYGGLLSFRLLGCTVGALVPVLACVAARRFGASLLSAAVCAACLSVQAQQVRYSAAVFPDPLAAAFGLAAVWAVAVRAPAAACALTICCVASKESFVAVPALIVALDLLMQRERGERVRLTRWHLLTFGLPVAYVGVVTSIALSSPSLRLQGWADSPFSLRHARSMWVGWELWPWLAWLAWRRQLRTLALWLALPLFYLLWSRGLGRGLAPWYVVGPAAFSSVASALALDTVYAACSGMQRRAAATWLVIAACLFCLAPIPLVGLAQVRAQLRQLAGRFPTPDAASQVQAVVTQQAPTRMLLVNCFWAYRYSHLRWGEPSQGVWWYNEHDTQDVLHNAETSSLVVTCKVPGRELIERQLREAPFELLYEDPNYLVSTAQSGRD
ncbi:MAG TPA: phospholipid carrier-dependent glycosyltransferase [Polyangiales bacterium]|nr:phospholipid carrier-dependent glycosyltransferase [Polyangiales bacterium]